MKIQLILLVFLVFSLGASGQKHSNMKSAHQLHLETNDGVEVLKKKISNAVISPLNNEAFEDKNYVVFGYLPYWELNRGALENIQFDLLSHIALFNFEVDSQGNLSKPSGWPWVDIINTAHTNGVKVIASLTNFNLSDNEDFFLLSDSQIHEKLFLQIKNLLVSNNLDGVNIDFEGLSVDNRGFIVNSFIEDLRIYLDNELPGTELSYAGPAVNWGGWDFDGLAENLDHIFIMGYDYNGGWSSTSGPIAPLLHPSGGISVTRTLTKDYASLLASNPQKLILGVPYYGKKWMTQSENAYSTVLDYIGSTFYKDDVLKFDTYGKEWREVEKSPWYNWQSTNWYQVWTEDSLSLSYKFDLAKEKNLAGVGMWALNYDADRKELWDLINEKFYKEPDLAMGEILLDKKFSIYPNPTNGKFEIKNLGSEFIIEVYSISTNKILSSRNRIPDLSNYPDAVYFLKILTMDGEISIQKLIKQSN